MNAISMELTEKLDKAIDSSEKVDDAIHDIPGGYNRCSELGWIDDCPRYLCLRRLCPEKEAARDRKMRRRLREGKLQEALIRADLGAAGIKLIHRKRQVWPKYKLTGEADDEVERNGNPPVPIDYKTCSSSMFQRIQNAQEMNDLLGSPFIWIRHYPAQLQAYMLMLGKPVSVLYFKDKESGLFHLLDIELDKRYSSRLLEGIDEVNVRVDKEDPWPAEYKQACQDCGFFSHDFPETDKATMAQGEIEIIEDQDWMMKLAEHQQIIDAGFLAMKKKFEPLDREIKDAFLGRKVMIGGHLIQSNPYSQTTYNVPQEVKDKYKEQAQRFRTSIKHLARPL